MPYGFPEPEALAPAVEKALIVSATRSYNQRKARYDHMCWIDSFAPEWKYDKHGDAYQVPDLKGVKWLDTSRWVRCRILRMYKDSAYVKTINGTYGVMPLHLVSRNRGTLWEVLGPEPKAA